MTCIEAIDWSWSHPNRVTPAINRLDLRIERGERVLILGPSGGGKSTFLTGLAGLLGVHDGTSVGQLRVDGRDVRERAHAVALLRQDPETSVLLGRVGDELRFGSENAGHSPEESARRAAVALQAVGLKVEMDHPTAQLSGGQKQRLAIAALLAMQPQLWLLDEPTAQLDAVGARQVREAVAHSLREDDTLLLVDHLCDDWWPLITRVIAFNRHGELVCDCTPDQALGSNRAILERLGVWLPSSTVDGGAGVLASSETLLRADNLEIGYSTPVAWFSGEIVAGTASVIRGQNGAGKSALALTLAGLISPLAGELEAAESWAPHRRAGVNREPIKWKARELAARIATVFQQPDLQFVLPTVLSELELGARSPRIARSLLERFGLDQYAMQPPRSLSGGEKRRLSVATALASSAELIIADEPTFGQDRHTWEVLTAALAEAAGEGRALVLPSHDNRLAARIGAMELLIGAQQ